MHGDPLAHADQPETPAVVGAAAPRPSSSTLTSRSSAIRIVTDAVAPGPACLRTLVSDSCTTRYAVSAAPSGTVTSGGGQRGGDLGAGRPRLLDQHGDVTEPRLRAGSR